MRDGNETRAMGGEKKFIPLYNPAKQFIGDQTYHCSRSSSSSRTGSRKINGIIMSGLR